MFSLRFPLFFCLLVLAGCAANRDRSAMPRQEPAPQVQRPASNATPRGQAELESAMAAAGVKQKEYRISPADLLEISVFQQPEWDMKLRVSEGGVISLPLIGEVKVGGLTQGEAVAALSRKLQQFLVNPQVSFFIREYGNKKIMVMGEVRAPGSYNLPPESKLSVLEAISLAGGFTGVAAPDRTKVIRNSEGRSRTITVTISDIIKRGDRRKDILLEPNDVIYVPQSFF